jgi:hypothetical protein
MHSLFAFGQSEKPIIDEEAYQQYLKDRKPTVYTPNPILVEIYEEIRNDPKQYSELIRNIDEQDSDSPIVGGAANITLRAMLETYGYSKAIPRLKEAIIIEKRVLEVENFFDILIETEEGRVIAEETALALLRDGSADTSKQLIALRVVGDLGNLSNAPIVQTYLDNEDERLKLKAGEILDEWEVDSADRTNSVEVSEEVTAPEPVVERSAKALTTEPTEEPAEKPSDWWLWLIAAVVVIGGLGLALRHKS